MVLKYGRNEMVLCNKKTCWQHQHLPHLLIKESNMTSGIHITHFRDVMVLKPKINCNFACVQQSAGMTVHWNWLTIYNIFNQSQNSRPVELP